MGMTSADMVRQNFERHSRKEVTEMMNNPGAPPSARDAVFDLIALISDPKGVKTRLEQLDAAEKAAAKAAAAAGDAKRLRAELDRELAEKRSTHDATLSSEREWQDTQHKQRHDALVAAERQAEERKAELDRRERAVAAREMAQDAKERRVKEAIGAL
jgi:hypothetical protein